MSFGFSQEHSASHYGSSNYSHGTVPGPPASPASISSFGSSAHGLTHEQDNLMQQFQALNSSQMSHASLNITPNNSIGGLNGSSSGVSAHYERVYELQTTIIQLQNRVSELGMENVRLQHENTYLKADQMIRRGQDDIKPAAPIASLSALPAPDAGSSADPAAAVFRRNLEAARATYNVLLSQKKKKGDFPWVKHFEESSWTAPETARKDVQREFNGGQRATSTRGEFLWMGFVQLRGGSAADASDRKAIADFFNQEFLTLDKYGLAPGTWGHASGDAKAYLYTQALEAFPYLGDGAGFWKVKYIATKLYPDFNKPTKADAKRARGDSAAPSSRSKKAKIEPLEEASAPLPAARASNKPDVHVDVRDDKERDVQDGVLSDTLIAAQAEAAAKSAMQQSETPVITHKAAPGEAPNASHSGKPGGVLFEAGNNTQDDARDVRNDDSDAMAVADDDVPAGTPDAALAGAQGGALTGAQHGAHSGAKAIALTGAQGDTLEVLSSTEDDWQGTGPYRDTAGGQVPIHDARNGTSKTASEWAAHADAAAPRMLVAANPLAGLTPKPKAKDSPKISSPALPAPQAEGASEKKKTRAVAMKKTNPAATSPKELFALEWVPNNSPNHTFAAFKRAWSELGADGQKRFHEASTRLLLERAPAPSA